MRSFSQQVEQCLNAPLRSGGIGTIQVNLGRRCNLSCSHCHVKGSPQRQEVMTWTTMQAILRLAEDIPDCRVDITGGAPEMNPHFRRFVTTLRDMGHPVQVRTNLTIFFEDGQSDLPRFYRDHEIQLVASLPCYLEENVNAQRGPGVYSKSSKGLQQLNNLGYGHRDNLPLSLVYNPGGPFLPPDQQALESAYRRELKERFDIAFNHLIAIANMPIGRFLDDLERQGKDEDYRLLLIEAFNPATLDGLMCRHQICVDWDGRLYDCDFNLSLEMPLAQGRPLNIEDATVESLQNRPIATGEHCYGCTAGAGSSCGGALVA
ncbi:MAG: radical SAM/Cys-rich domain protein [Desulfuromonadales bacterium]|nr:radical SAM/Cys-rich domain protein [Desulfuromonadales bacterium]NIR33311.1 radical SAM/Cys-rich domain protein [Desulfuromonadales bacterium]NIS42097.1 radical SAM/Cys-rich domain protein [Desulfuromonadales bacterium]